MFMILILVYDKQSITWNDVVDTISIILFATLLQRESYGVSGTHAVVVTKVCRYIWQHVW